jgi:hypothetical protein
MATGRVRRQPHTHRFGSLPRSLLCGGLALYSSWALGARDEEIFHVSVSIPSSEFHVLPVSPEFLEREQSLHWNTVTQTLGSLRENFDVKNIAGGINARLGYEPYLSNGRDRIELQVTFNGVALELTDNLVVEEADAKAGKRVQLLIAALEPDDGYRPGEYYGNVQIVFDALRP